MRTWLTHDLAAFLDAPIGRCVVGPTFVVWCHSRELVGMSLWGAPDDRATCDAIGAIALERNPHIALHRRSLLDCRDIDSPDVESFARMVPVIRDRASAWAAAVGRQAVLLDPGLTGLLIAGTMVAAGSQHPVKFTHDVDAAIAYLDHPAAAEAHRAASRVAVAARGDAALVARVRSLLRRDPGAITMDDCAGALEVSPRTLQRVLRRHHTSYRDELRRVRVDAAKALLLHSDLKLEAIAARVGLGTASRLSAALRREGNLSARELRDTARG